MNSALDSRRSILLLTALALLVLLAGTAALPLLDRDEPRFARATAEMMARGDWIIPWFNDGYRFDKPPLTYWLMAVGYLLLGVGEMGARLHSVLAAVLATVAVYALGTRMFDARVGFAAAFGWATSLQVYLHGRLALADMPMILAVLIAHWALWELLFADGDGRWRHGLWLALAAGFLAKGPIALIAPAITLGVVRLAVGRTLPWRRLGAATGVPLALALIGAWGIPALLRTQGAFWQVGIGHHVVERGLDAFNERPIVPFYYFATVFLSLFPWSPNLGQLVAGIRGAWGDERVKFLAAWICGPFLVFSLYSTQLPHYTLPAFPALLLLLFRGPSRSSAMAANARRFYVLLHAVFGLAFLTLGAYLLTLDHDGDVGALVRTALLLIAALLALQAAALAFARRRDDTVGGLAPALVALLLVAAATIGFTRTLRPLTAPVRLLPFHQRVAVSGEHVARGYTEPSLVFYGDATWDFGTGVPAPAELATGSWLVVYRGREVALDRLLRGADDPCAEGAGGSAGEASREGSGSATPSTARATIDARARSAGVPRAVVASDLDRAAVCGLNLARSTWTELFVFYRE